MFLLSGPVHGMESEKDSERQAVSHQVRGRLLYSPGWTLRLSRFENLYQTLHESKREDRAWGGKLVTDSVMNSTMLSSSEA